MQILQNILQLIFFTTCCLSFQSHVTSCTFHIYMIQTHIACCYCKTYFLFPKRKCVQINMSTLSTFQQQCKRIIRNLITWYTHAAKKKVGMWWDDDDNNEIIRWILLTLLLLCIVGYYCTFKKLHMFIC